MGLTTDCRTIPHSAFDISSFVDWDHTSKSVVRLGSVRLLYKSRGGAAVTDAAVSSTAKAEG